MDCPPVVTVCIEYLRLADPTSRFVQDMPKCAGKWEKINLDDGGYPDGIYGLVFEAHAYARTVLSIRLSGDKVAVVFENQKRAWECKPQATTPIS